ncbi:SRPBCC domain-containing protein [Xanthomonas citri]|nr:SRPBCC domain-containing protein [Xanthomonas citri]MDS0759813.1 SRPBCC domain-containing protein [Xanthomonas citri pv. punicae]MDS0763589.1 SRPBCC domain-containing protein [Xanthomonas citri pv. punicae]MDS0798361.1 SRPBCC domain-containing protein [Xanthomonas citri pv. punicae]MDS0830992.1 SRPBCC domain-containing protein [Xanthomonas citri pv. punicae]MDS0834804.1 SRPBCC domain-containing protein [Xanthomonas citri pv. punicae]
MKTSDSLVRIFAPASKVWKALTVPELVKQWQYGSDLLTTWEVGTPIIFRNEWNGQVFEQKGTVLEFLPESRLSTHCSSRAPICKTFQSTTSS